VGLHWPAIADIDGLSPYFSSVDTAHAGCRDDDEQIREATVVLGAVLPTSQIRHQGVEQAARRILTRPPADRLGQLGGVLGYRVSTGGGSSAGSRSRSRVTAMIGIAARLILCRGRTSRMRAYLLAGRRG
jgi:hypothetical protein